MNNTTIDGVIQFASSVLDVLIADSDDEGVDTHVRSYNVPDEYGCTDLGIHTPLNSIYASQTYMYNQPVTTRSSIFPPSSTYQLPSKAVEISSLCSWADLQPKHNPEALYKNENKRNNNSIDSQAKSTSNVSNLHKASSQQNTINKSPSNNNNNKKSPFSLLSNTPEHTHSTHTRESLHFPNTSETTLHPKHNTLYTSNDPLNARKDTLNSNKGTPNILENNPNYRDSTVKRRDNLGGREAGPITRYSLNDDKTCPTECSIKGDSESVSLYSESISIKQRSNLKSENNTTKKHPPYTQNHSLNSCIYIYDGQITDLDVDAIVCFNNEQLSFTDPESSHILKVAGNDLRNEIDKIEELRTGEVYVTDAYNLYCRHIFHTIGPRFNSKYASASHNLLHTSYRECLKTMIDMNLRTIAFPYPLNVKRQFPSNEGMHTILRTLRRWLEYLNGHIEAIVLTSPNSQEVELYQNILPVYFPRSTHEQQRSIDCNEAYLGDQFGELHEEERKIRIGVIDTHLNPNTSLRTDKHSSTHSQTTSNKQPIFTSKDISFTQSNTTADLSTNTPNNEEETKSLEGERLHKRFLKESMNLCQTSIFEELSKSHFIYFGGEDNLNRKIVVFLTALLPAKRYDSKHLLLYIVHTLEPLIRDKFVLLYVNAEASLIANSPGFSLFTNFLKLYFEKYQDNLDQLLILYPGRFFRAAFYMCWPLLSSNVWNGTKYLHSLKELGKLCNINQLGLPRYVFEFDQNTQI